MKKVLLSMMLLIASLASFAYDFEVDGIYYNVLSKEDLTCEVTSGNLKYKGDVEIPATITYEEHPYSVISIGYRAFYFCEELTSVSLPNSVTLLDDQSFKHCTALKSFTIPQYTISIAHEAFRFCTNLRSVYIPKSVKYIGFNAFRGCSGITSISVDPENTVYDSRNGCNAIIEIESNKLVLGCVNTIIPNTVKTIDETSFAYCKFKTITIPTSVNYINNRAFYNCPNLTSISIPYSINYLDESFYGCSSLTEVYCYTKMVPNSKKPFEGCNLGSATLYVSEEVLNSFKNDPSWGEFGSIVVLENTLYGDYLIQNVEGGYLSGGNEWGSHASLLNTPQWFTTTLNNGTNILDSHQSNGGENHYLSGNLYTDAPAYGWTITQLADGSYTISNGEGMLLAAVDGMNKPLSLLESTTPVPASARWRFVNMEEVVAEMSNASSQHPIDVTALIKDPEFKRNGNTMWKAWTITGYDGVGVAKNFSEGQNGKVANCAESFHSSNGFKAVQTITLPKAGVYTLTAQGFYRQDDDLTEEPPCLFAGEHTSALPVRTGTENNMEDAYAAFLDKKYPVEPIIIIAEEDNEVVQIGFAGSATHIWNIFGELELKYCGKYFSPVATDGETVQYLYNIDAKGFVVGVNDGGVRASVDTETGYKFKVKANGDGTYTLNDYSHGLDDQEWSWRAMYAVNGTNIWMDNANGANADKWVITPVAGEENVYEITNPSAAQGKLGVKTDLSEPRLYINNENGYSTRWAFMSEEAYKGYLANVEKQKILDDKNTISLAAQKELIDGTNIYEKTGYDAYVSQYEAYVARLAAGTLKEEVVNPNVATGVRTSTAYNFLLTPWTLGGESCNNFDKSLYVNTWSIEGETDGSNFLVPFLEYFANADRSLSANKIVTKVTDLNPNSTYEVKVLARVRIKDNTTGTPYGISMTVGNGESVNLCGGQRVGNTQMYLAEFTAEGTVDNDGNLVISIDVAEDNNVHWLAFKNVKYSWVTYFINDGTNYTQSEMKNNQRIMYTRTYNNTNWQALYVPFSMQYEDWCENFEVAYLNDVHQYDTDDDGDIDVSELEVIKMRRGQTEPNMPYLIRAKKTGTQSIVVENTTIYPAEAEKYDVSSWNTLFNFQGTYSGVSGSEMMTNGYYAYGGGALIQAKNAASNLKPFRWYMYVTDRYGNRKELNEARISIVFPEDDNETGVNELQITDSELQQPEGRYMENGKIVIVKNGIKYNLNGQRIN